MVHAVTGLTVFGSLAFAAVGLFSGIHWQTPIFGGYALFSVMPAVLLRRSWSLSVVAWWQAVSMLLFLLFLSANPDSTRTWSVAWCAIVPFVAMSVAGSRTAFKVAALTILVQVVCLLIYYYGVTGPAPPRVELLPVELVDATLMTLVVTFVGGAIERTKREVMQQVLDSNSALVTEVVEHRQTQIRLEETQADLIRVARGAGMAEVASGVLHNVGNALNSVRTSASVVRDGTFWEVHARALARVSSLLRERRPALLEAGEERVAQLPLYLDRLTERGFASVAGMRNELQRMSEQVDHISAVIALQDEHARAQNVVTRVDVREVIDQALQLVCGEDPPFDARVRCGELEPLWTDRHQLLQIVLSLLNNAKDELSSLPPDQRHLAIDVHATKSMVCLEVSDSGGGVREDLREQIFQHGFSTKVKGGGVGLHMSALSARGLGGGLVVADSGAFPGATLRLSLPVRSP